MFQDNSQSDKKGRGLKLLMEISAQGKSIFTTDEAVGALGVSREQIKKILYRLVKKGWLKRVERSKYLIVPFEAGVEREWSEDVFVIASYLVTPYSVAYWSALSYWNLTEQIPRTVFIQTSRRKSKRRKQILGIFYQFIVVKSYKFFGITPQWFGHKKINITNVEKTIVDCLDRPDLCGGIVEVSKDIHNARRENKLNLKKTLDYSLKMRNRSIIKRLGFICETLDIEDKLFWDKVSKKISGGYVYLDPSSVSKRYTINSQWKLIVNVSSDALKGWNRA